MADGEARAVPSDGKPGRPARKSLALSEAMGWEP